MEPKKLYTIAWTQTYNPQEIVLAELQALLDQVIEAVLEEGDFAEADYEIDRIMKL